MLIGVAGAPHPAASASALAATMSLIGTEDLPVELR
jgi:hypothetical protein